MKRETQATSEGIDFVPEGVMMQAWHEVSGSGRKRTRPIGHGMIVTPRDVLTKRFLAGNPAALWIFVSSLATRSHKNRSYRPYGTGLYGTVFQAFHARLPSSVPPGQMTLSANCKPDLH